MAEDISTDISGHDEESITIRGKTLSTEIIGELRFSEAAFLIITGREPEPVERDVFDRMLTSLLAHGMTSHSIAARLTYSADPESVQGAVASGILGIGSRSAGAVRPCANQLVRISESTDVDEAIESLAVDSELTEPFGVSGFPGIGHGYFDDVDPRAKEIVDAAQDHEIAGLHVRNLQKIQREFERQLDADLPINVIGAISATALDMDLSPVMAQGITILSRTAGLIAEVESEHENPVAGDIRSVLDDHVKYEGE